MNQPLLIYAAYLPATAVTATDTAAELDPNDVLLAEEDNAWMPANTSGSKALVIDLSIPQEIGCMGIVGENLNEVTIEVHGSTDNFVASDVQVYAPTTITEFIAAWCAWTNATYRYWKVIFSGFGSSFSVAHIALCPFNLLPFFADGVDPDAYYTEGSQLVSPDGHFLGSNRLRTMLVPDLDWGQVYEEEFVLFQAWADACVHNMSAFFLVPDSSQSACYFSWLKDPKFAFKAPRNAGLRTMPTIAITSRVP